MMLNQTNVRVNRNTQRNNKNNSNNKTRSNNTNRLANKNRSNNKNRNTNKNRSNKKIRVFEENQGYYGSNKEYRPYRSAQPFPYVAQSMMIPTKSELRASAQVFIPKPHQTMKSYHRLTPRRKTIAHNRLTLMKLK